MNEWCSLVVQHLLQRKFICSFLTCCSSNLNVINSSPHTWEKSQPLFQDLMLICLAEYQIISPLQSKVSTHAYMPSGKMCPLLTAKVSDKEADTRMPTSALWLLKTRATLQRFGLLSVLTWRVK